MHARAWCAAEFETRGVEQSFAFSAVTLEQRPRQQRWAAAGPPLGRHTHRGGPHRRPSPASAAAAMAAHGIVLRNHALVGGTARRVELPMAHRTTFEEGATLIFARWTALQLGVQNEWGGPRSSQKAQQLLRDVIGWFYNTKGRHATPCMRACCRDRPACRAAHPRPTAPAGRGADHELCDLQDLLDEALQLDFNIQAEDDSPYQVSPIVTCALPPARALCRAHYELRFASANGLLRHAGRPAARQYAQPGGSRGLCVRARNARSGSGGATGDGGQPAGPERPARSRSIKQLRQ